MQEQIINYKLISKPHRDVNKQVDSLQLPNRAHTVHRKSENRRMIRTINIGFLTSSRTSALTLKFSHISSYLGPEQNLAITTITSLNWY